MLKPINSNLTVMAMATVVAMDKMTQSDSDWFQHGGARTYLGSQEGSV